MFRICCRPTEYSEIPDMMKNKTIALYDPFISGHHLSYLLLYAQALSDLGYNIWIFNSKTESVKESVRISIKKTYNSIRYHNILVHPPNKNPGSVLKTAIYTLRLWNQAGRDVYSAVKKFGNSPDLVYFLWLDSYLSEYLFPVFLDVVFPYKWAGLYFHPGRIGIEKRNQIKSNNYKVKEAGLISKNCQFLSLLDEGILPDFQRILPQKSVVCFPDVTYNALPEKTDSLVVLVKKKAKGRKIIGLLGSLQKRKGTLMLLKIAEMSRKKNLFFLFAGRLVEDEYTTEELQMINNAKNEDNCMVITKFIPDERDINGLFQICDVIFAAYHTFFHSSNLLAKAAVFGKPVIVSDGYCMAERVRKYHLGYVIHEGNVDECASAIHRLTASDKTETEKLLNGLKHYRDDYSMVSLKSSLRDILSKINI